MPPCIVGWAHTPIDRLDQLDLETLITTVARDAIADAGIAASDIDALWMGNINQRRFRAGYFLFIAHAASRRLQYQRPVAGRSARLLHHRRAAQL